MSALRPPTLEDVCRQAMHLPCSPSLLPRLIAVIEDPRSGAAEIESLIQLDSALAGSTLRLANSAFFSTGRPVETVSEAVVRLGQREIFRLAALALVNRWESGAQRGASRGEAGDFCRQALCTAVAAEVLAEAGERVDPQTAYTAGLVCDLGKLALTHACHPFFPAIRLAHARLGGSWLAAERDVLGYDHTQVGTQLLRAWRFPDLLVATAEFGHQPDQAPEETLSLMAHVHAAKYLATSLGPGVTEEGFFFELRDQFLLKWGFTPEFLHEALPSVLDRATVCLREKLTHGAMR